MVGPDMTTFKAKKGFNRTTLFGQMGLFGLVIFFQLPLDFLMRCFFMVTRISIVHAQLDLGLLSV